MGLGDFGHNDSGNDSIGRILSLGSVDTGRGYAQGGERELLAALLFDGVQSFVHFKNAKGDKTRARYLEGYRWVTSRAVDYPFSFENVCEALGVAPEYVRNGLTKAGSRLLEELGKSRRHS